MIRDYLHPIFGEPGTEELLSSLAGEAVSLSFSAGERIFASGDACRHFIIVASGEVRVRLSTKNGREITLYHLSRGEPCALTTSCLLRNTPYYAEGLAETDVELLAFPSARFLDSIAASPLASRHLLMDFAVRISGMTALIDRLAARDIETELSDFLLSHQSTDGNVTLSHKAIAAEIGTAREVVSRKLKELERAGVIRLGRGEVRILDAGMLERLSGG